MDFLRSELTERLQIWREFKHQVPRRKKTTIILGHDECIFKQYQFKNKEWVSDEGTREILPKDKGMGVMISAFQSREFGFGRPLTKDDLQRVNEKRKGEFILRKQANNLLVAEIMESLWENPDQLLS